MSRIVTIFGATGLQGGSVLKAVQKDGTFTPRAVTRSLESSAAKELAAQGVDVVQADLSDYASVEKAVAGSEAVFGVTNSWDPTLMANPELEIVQGQNLVNAIKKTGVKYYVWSSLPNVTELSKGKYTLVHHCDNKYKIDKYLGSSGVAHTIIHTSWFAENLWRLQVLAPHPSDAEKYAITVPHFDPKSKQVITFAGRDVGPSVLALLKNYDNEKESKEILGKTFNIASVRIDYTTLAEKISKSLGKPVEFLSPESSGLKELDEMYGFQSDGINMAGSELPPPWFTKHGVSFGGVEDLVKEGVDHVVSK